MLYFSSFYVEGSFHEIGDSYYSHSETFGLGNYRGKAFTTGCSPKSSEWNYIDRWGDKDSCKRRTEIQYNDFHWTKYEDYPFATGDEYVFYA